MAYVDFHHPPKGKQNSITPTGGEVGQQVSIVGEAFDEGCGGEKSARRPKSREALNNRSSAAPSSAAAAKQRSVTFKFKEMLEHERPSLAAMFPMTRLPGMTEYLIISDEEFREEEGPNEADTGRQKKKKNLHNSNNKKSEEEDEEGVGVPMPAHALPRAKTQQQRDLADDADSETENEEIFKIERSFKEKLSHLTKDLGNLLSQPTNNFREYLRRREGYVPPDKDGKLKHLNEADDDDALSH